MDRLSPILDVEITDSTSLHEIFTNGLKTSIQIIIMKI